MKIHLPQTKVLLIGLGESGLACARWLLRQQTELTIADTRDCPPGLDKVREVKPEVVCLRNLDEVIWDFQLVVVSPGLAPSHPLMQQVLGLAGQHATPVHSELDLFAWALEELVAQGHAKPKVIGITGTNGKTTTTRMVEHMINHAGQTAVAAGNISPAALDALIHALDANALPQVWVLELSSFQLHWTHDLVCDASVVLNVTQDHLDWHASMQEYASDKARVFGVGRVSVKNRDDAVVMDLPLPEGAVEITFGTNPPTEDGDFGLVREGGMLWLSHAQPAQDEKPGRRRKNEEPAEVSVNLLMPTDALQVAGLHNATNALAALALCKAVGIPMAKLLHGLRTFKGEPHRVEFILQVAGVDYIDDSKGTNVGATVAALNGLARATILVAGGDGKGQDFSPLLGPVSAYCKGVVLIGKDAPTIAKELEQTAVPLVNCVTLEEAVTQAAQMATPGDCVLLSPACASLDMFQNYKHRADVFVQSVRNLALDGGQPC